MDKKPPVVVGGKLRLKGSSSSKSSTVKKNSTSSIEKSNEISTSKVTILNLKDEQITSETTEKASNKRPIHIDEKDTEVKLTESQLRHKKKLMEREKTKCKHSIVV
jgi:hypothetical protein